MLNHMPPQLAPVVETPAQPIPIQAKPIQESVVSLNSAIPTPETNPWRHEATTSLLSTMAQPAFQAPQASEPLVPSFPGPLPEIPQMNNYNYSSYQGVSASFPGDVTEAPVNAGVENVPIAPVVLSPQKFSPTPISQVSGFAPDQAPIKNDARNEWPWYLNPETCRQGGHSITKILDQLIKLNSREVLEDVSTLDRYLRSLDTEITILVKTLRNKVPPKVSKNASLYIFIILLKLIPDVSNLIECHI